MIRDTVCAGPFLKMFQACTLVMRRDSQTAMFLLPYIVQVLCHAGPMHAYTRLQRAFNWEEKVCLVQAICTKAPACTEYRLHAGMHDCSFAGSSCACCGAISDSASSRCAAQMSCRRANLSRLVQDAVCTEGDSARQHILAEIAAVLEHGYASAEGCLCVQAVFALTDVLKDWLEQRRPATPSPASRILGLPRQS